MYDMLAVVALEVPKKLNMYDNNPNLKKCYELKVHQRWSYNIPIDLKFYEEQFFNEVPILYFYYFSFLKKTDFKLKIMH